MTADSRPEVKSISRTLTRFEALGFSLGGLLLWVAALPYVLAFRGTRALGILHSFFVLPAIGLLIAFCLCGLGWLMFHSPGLLPSQGISFSMDGWTKWYFMAIYAVYGVETGSSFVADSQRPRTTLNFIAVAAVLLPLVYLGGSLIIDRLSPMAVGSSPFIVLVTAAKPFWGEVAPWAITLLMASGSLLTSATAVSNCPRILYQLSFDRYLAPVFGVVSPRGVFGPGLCLTLLLSWLCLFWGNVDRVVMITGTSYIISMMSFHLGMWLQRHRPESLWPKWSLGFLCIETLTLVIGGIAWSWQDLLLGLLLPIAIGLINWGIQQVRFAPFRPQWWWRIYQPKVARSKDFLLTQVVSLLCIICLTTTAGWWVRSLLNASPGNSQSPLLILVLLIVAFIGVAIACWRCNSV